MIVFAHHKKTAGTTFKFILRANFAMNHCQTAKSKKQIFRQSDFNRAKRLFPNLKSILGHNVIAPTEYLQGEHLFFATILREPLARMASHYQDHCLRGNFQGTFKEWIEQFPHFTNTQVRRIAGEPNLDKAKNILATKYHYLGLTEDFDQSLRLFQVLSPFDVAIHYNKRNQAVNDDIKNRLLTNEKKALQECNNLDIELYDFAKTEVYPKLLQNHRFSIQKADQPKVLPSSYKPLSFRASKFYNNVIYSSAEKVVRKLENNTF